MTDHPSYPNDTILEALCEFRLKPSAHKSWGPKSPSEIMRKIGMDEFPGMEPINEIGVELIVENGHPSQRIIQGPPKVRYSSDDGKRLIQAAPNLYAFNAIANYPGWVSMKESIVKNWSSVSDVLDPQEIERIGLRYINKVAFPMTEQLSDWFKSSEYVPERFINSKVGSNLRLEMGISDVDAITITMLTQLETENQVSAIFDIDRGFHPRGLLNTQEIEERLEILHDDVWSAFKSSMTEKLEARMKGPRE